MRKKFKEQLNSKEYSKLLLQNPQLQIREIGSPLSLFSDQHPIPARIGFESEIAKSDIRSSVEEIEKRRKSVIDLSIRNILMTASAKEELDHISKTLQLGLSSEHDLPPEVVHLIKERQNRLGEKTSIDSTSFDRLCEDPKFIQALKLTGDSVESFRARVESGRKIFEWLQTLGTENQARLQRLIDHLIKVSKEIEPPKPVSSNNIETLMMLLARTFLPFEDMPREFDHPYFEEVMSRTNEQFPKVFRLRQSLGLFMEHDYQESLFAFGYGWQKSSFARLEVGHKLAASLCLTDVPPEVEVKAPWNFWSMIVPDGLIWEGKGPRVWIAGTDPIFLVNDTVVQAVSTEMFQETAKEKPGPESDFHLRCWSMLINLVRGACLALSNPSDFKKERSGSKHQVSTKRSSGEPAFDQARFLLSAPVKIDLREQVREYVDGTRKGTSPKVQFLVRGHWRNQAHGPKNQLRKTIWVAPFWKGNEEARILLRQVKVGSNAPGEPDSSSEPPAPK